MIDDSQIDDSIIKRDFIKIYHQHGAEVNNENQSIKFYFGENLNYIQKGRAYLEIDIEVRKADRTKFTKLMKSDWSIMDSLIFFKKEDYLQVPERK